MEMTSLARKRAEAVRMAAAIAVVLASVAVPVSSGHTAGDNISVSCYQDGTCLGTVIAFSPETAGQLCNSFYYSCKGKCYGCFSDFDLSEDVCYDNAGKKFLK